MSVIEIDVAELLDHYGSLREIHEGRGESGAAAQMAIDFLFEILGEPGVGE